MTAKETGKPAGKPERPERLAEALRANLQKRKGQARARRQGEADQRQGMQDGKPKA
ncbi:MAG: hypothetical protein AB7I79_24270 [Rhizobiaceae bacterium]